MLCDVPCSGFGVAKSKPDIYLRRKESDISALSAIQSKILSNASGYVKDGGRIIYSTCTILREENEDIVARFVEQSDDFKLISEKKYLPDGKGADGFYIAVMEKSL